MTRASRIVSLVVILSLVLLAIPFQPAEVWAGGVTCLTDGPSDVWVAPPPVGNDGYPGTQAQPFATIQWGLDHVAYNGTVHVAAGTYRENLNISCEQNLVGAGAQNTIIDGSGSGRVIRISSLPMPNTITGFTIQNGYYISNLWNPAHEQVLFAGINLKFMKLLPQLFSISFDGGGIYIGTTHIVTLNDCVIKNNQAEYGGGIYNEGQLYMNRCTISGNSAIYDGGGIYNTPGWYSESGKMWLTNCTISGNTVTGINGMGAGIYNAYDMTLLNVTVANNTATGTGSRGGGFANMIGNDTAFFKNCIVANNAAGIAYTNNGYTENIEDTISQGHNLDSENSCNFDQPTDLVNTNPQLSPLQDNGGPSFTHALLNGSPAINAGTNAGAPATDQRGVARPQPPGGICDIGAYELISVATATGTGIATFAINSGSITALTAATSTPCGTPSVLSFPHGFFSFTITNLTPGATITITITLPSAMPTGTQYWKCQNGRWIDCTSLLGDNDGDNVLTLTLKDGGLGDADGVANGTIIDPGAPAIQAQPTVTTINPTSGMQGQTLNTIITGINFTGATAVSFGAGITVNSFRVDSDTQITASITIAGNAATGARNVSVTTPFGTGTLTGGFTVNPASVAAPSGPKASPSMTQPPDLLSPAQLSAQYVTVSPQQTTAGQPVTITTNVVNTGDEAGEFNVALKINGQVEQSRMVSVAPQGIQSVEFTVNKAQPGTYNVDILGKGGNFTILDAVSSTSSPSENSGSKTGYLIALAFIGILVVAGVVVLLVRRT